MPIAREALGVVAFDFSCLARRSTQRRCRAALVRRTFLVAAVLVLARELRRRSLRFASRVHRALTPLCPFAPTATAELRLVVVAARALEGTSVAHRATRPTTKAVERLVKLGTGMRFPHRTSVQSLAGRPAASGRMF